MNKQLTPLEALKKIKVNWDNVQVVGIKYFKIVETALKDYEKIRQLLLSCDIENTVELEKTIIRNRKIAKHLHEVVLKKNKALELIKKMFDWEAMLPSYGYMVEVNTITQEEFDLLKEVLCK